MKIPKFILLPFFSLMAVGCVSAETRSDANGKWVAAWGMAPKYAHNQVDVGQKTLRETIHVSFGSDKLRLRFSNAYGKGPLHLGPANIQVDKKTFPVLFNGRPSVFIPQGAFVISDIVEAPVAALSDPVVRVYLPDPTICLTRHGTKAELTEISAKGDFTDSKFEPTSSAQGWCFLTGLDELVPDITRGVVALGDSITDADSFMPDPNVRWLDLLAQQVDERHLPIAFVNMGISGSRLLYSDPEEKGFGVSSAGMDRFDRDIIAQPGATDIIVLLGTNDIGRPGDHAPLHETVTSNQMISNFIQLAKRAHEKKIHIFFGTILPFKGSRDGYYSAEKEKTRQEVNEWIRKNKISDGLIDFDLAMRDPKDPIRLKPEVDLGDHLHPSQEGQSSMAKAVKLELFRN